MLDCFSGQLCPLKDDFAGLDILDTNTAVGTLEATEALGHLALEHLPIGLAAQDFDTILHGLFSVVWVGFRVISLTLDTYYTDVFQNVKSF